MKTLEINIDDLKVLNEATNVASVKNLKRNAFFILNEFFTPLLNDDERETFTKLMDSIEGRS